MSSKPHYFIFYPSYWNSLEVTKLSLEEQGILIRLMVLIHNNELNLPDDDDGIAKVMGISKKLWLKTKEKFLKNPKPLIFIENGMIFNSEIVKSFDDFSEKVKQRSVAGKASAEKRKAKTEVKQIVKASEDEFIFD